MSEGREHERRTHFRGKPRPGRTVELAYWRDDGADGPPCAAQTRNIGVGGAFIVTASPEPIGTVLRLAVQVPTAARPIEVTAEVRWCRRDAADPGGDGMGVKFRELEVDQLVALSEYFASLTGADPQADLEELS